MSGTLKIGGKTLATHDTSSNKLAFHSDANDTGQLCRAWVNFDGTGTVAIRASFNVSSVGDNGGLGNFRVNFTTAMPDADYCVQLSTSTPTGGAGQHAIDENDITTTYVDVLTWNYNASAQTDRNHYYVSIFR